MSVSKQTSKQAIRSGYIYMGFTVPGLTLAGSELAHIALSLTRSCTSRIQSRSAVTGSSFGGSRWN